MKRVLKADFKFQPIGQGGFYTGKINRNSRFFDEFNIVYDCGTLSKSENLKESIKLYKEHDLFRKKLDVLMLSHLDNDHVNGVTQLLESITCNHIYLPYLTPLQRLIVAIRHNSTDIIDETEFINFIISPHDYLLNIDGASIGEIVYILGNQDEEYTGNESPNEPININELEFNFDDSLKIIKPEDFSDEMKNISGTNSKTKIVFKKGNNAVRINLIWEFYLYNELADDKKIEQYIIEVRRICGLKVTDIVSKSDLEEILRNSEKINELRKKFRDIFKNLNKMGLVVQHKPLGYRNAVFKKMNVIHYHTHYFNQYRRIFSRNIFENNSIPANYNWGITLLTGDISLTQIENSAYIKKHLSENLVFQVPHHGSETGWKKEFLAGLNNNGKTAAIINFGYGNIYGHPRYTVLKDLDDNNFDIRFCNQFEFFNYNFILQF